MPKVRRQSLPSALLEHLIDRVRDRAVPFADLELLARRFDSQPEVPPGRWYKRFPDMSVCGEGELVKTFLDANQTPVGKEVK